MRAKLYIDNTEADLGKLTFTIDLIAKEVEKLKTTKANKTTTINLPATATNKKLFDFLEDTNIDKQLTLRDGRLEIGALRFIGKIKEYESIKNRDNITYRIQLISSSGDWAKLIEGKKLNDLDFSGDDHTYNKATMDTSETYDTESDVNIRRNYVYPVINYGETIDGDALRLVERYPAISIYAIIYKIFQEQGYRISGELMTLILKMHLPYTQSSKKDNLTDEQLEDDLYNVMTQGQSRTESIPGDAVNHNLLLFSGNTANNEVIPLNYEAIDNGTNYNTTTFEYTVPYDRTMNFKGRFTIRFNIGLGITNINPAIKIEIKVNPTAAGADYAIAEINDTTTVTAVGQTDVRLTLESNYMPVKAGDKVYAKITVTDTIDNDPNAADYSLTYHSGRIENTVLDWYGYGDAITISNFLPDTLQTDFLKAIFHFYNVYPFTDPQRKIVYLSPKLDAYDYDNAWNWSDKLDTSRQIRTLKPYEKNYKFGFKEDSNDKWAKKKQRENEDLTGGYDYEITEPEAIIEILNNLIAVTLMDTYSEIGFVTDKIPKLWSEVPEAANGVALWTTKFELRMLYYNGIQSMSGAETWKFKSGNGTELADKEEDRSTYPDMLSVSSSYNLYFNEMNSLDGLFETYWRKAIEQINQEMQIEAYFNLNLNDIQGIMDVEKNRDFRTPVYLDQTGYRGYYEILSIKRYNPFNDESVKVLLIKRNVSTTPV